MKKLNILSKTDGWSSGHGTVTSGTTVGSPSVHRRGALLKLLSVLVLVLTFGVGQMWGAEGDTHEFSYSDYSSFPQQKLLNNNATINSVSLTEISYPIKKVTLEGKTNNANGKVSIEVRIGETSLGSQTASGKQNYSLDYQTDPVSSLEGDISIVFTNNSGSGTGKGSFWLNTVIVTEGASETSYTITPATNNESYGTVSLDGSVITGSPKSGYRYADPAYSVTVGTATVAQNGDAFTVTPSSDCTVQINFEPIPTYTVTLKDDNTTLPQGSAGASVTLPSRDDCGNYTFAGWTKTWTSEVSTETTTAPEIIPAGSYTPTDNVNLYPVYTRVESGSGASPTAYSVGDVGDFVLAVNVNEKWYAIPTNPTVNNGKIAGVEIEVSTANNVNYVSSSNAAGYAWTIAASGNYYTLFDGTYYLYHSSGGSSGTNLAIGTTASYKWNISSDEDGLLFAGVSGTTVGSRGMLSNGTTFGGYSLTNKNATGYYRVQVLPIAAGSTTYYISSPNCSASTCEDPTIGTQPVSAEYAKDDAASVTPLSVSATGSGTLAYQWYSNTTASNDGGTPISEATSASYTPAVDEVGTFYYYCVVGIQGETCKTASNVATITVTQAVESIELDETAIDLEVDATKTLAATVKPNDATNKAVEWESSNPAIATVDENGKVTAVAKGTAIITCKSKEDANIKATCNVTVTAAPSYKKVTAALEDWSGEYLLVYENSETEAYVWTGDDADNSYATATISDEKINKPANGVKLIVAALTGENEGKYSIQVVGGDNNGKYVGRTAGSNGMNFDDAAIANVISYSGGLTICNTTSTVAKLLYNSNNKRFRYYTSSQKAVQLYRKVVTSAVTITAPAEGTGLLTLADGQTAVASGDNIEAGTQLTVTATPNSGNHYIGGTVVVKDGNNTDVTSQVLSGTTLTMPEYAITVSATFTPTYAITGASVVGGSFSWKDEGENENPAYVAAGVLVQASANATAGYVFGGEFDIYQTGTPATKVTDEDGLFEMPAYAVTIGGTFNEAPTITLSQTSTMAFTKVATGASTSAKFTVSAANLTAGSLSVTNGGTNPDKFNLSVGSITVTAGAVTDAEVTVTPITTAAGDYSATITVDDGEGGAAAQSFNVTLHVEDQYTAKWWVNGVEQTTYSVTEFAGADLTFPDAPTPTGDCAGTEFKGWLTAPLTEASADEPEGLIKTYTGHTMPAANVNYYAVFADQVSDGNPAGYSLSASAPADGDQVIIARLVSDTYYAMTTAQTPAASALTISDGIVSEPTASVIWDVEEATSGVYLKSGSNYLHMNSTALKVASEKNNGDIVFSANNNGSFKGTRADEARWIVTNGTNGFGCSDTEANAAELYFFKYSAASDPTYGNYVTTCMACSSVSLVEAGETNGTITLKQGTKAVSSVKTCNGAVTLTTNAVAEPGYELTKIELSGVANATVNQEMTEITIPANATGELTVTATFSQKNYEVIVEEYPVIGATLTGATTTAHYNDEITISTNEPAGYKFSGWCMYEVTDIERETDIADQFFTGDYDEYEFATTAKFKMPNRSIVAEANFKKIYSVDEFMDTEFTKTNNKWYYVTGLVAEVPAELYSGTKMTYVISDDATKSGLYLTLYRGLGEDSENFSAVSDLAVGDKVVVYGQWSSSYKNLNEGNYIITRTPKGTPTVVIGGSAEKTAYSENDNVFSFAGLTATATYNTSYTKDVTAEATWKANGENPYTVSAGGTVTVTATFEEQSGSKDVTVTYTTKTVKSLSLSFDATTAYIGQACPEPVVTAIYEEDIPDEEVTATFDKSAYNANVADTYTIGVSYQGKETSYTVTVKSVANENTNPYTVAEARNIIDIDREDGNDLALANAGNKVYVQGIVTSVTSNEIKINVAADDEKPLSLWKYTLGTNFETEKKIESVAVGENIIAYGNLLYYEGTYSDKYELNEGCEVVWKAPVAVESIELAATATVKVGKTVQLTANVLPENASNKEVTWSITSGDTYAEVSATGLVKGLEIGEAVIRATSVADANIHAECTVTVKAAPVTIKFNKVTATEDITNGEYLIVYEDGNVAFDGSLTTLDAENNTIDVVVEDGVIELENANANAVFTIDATAGTIQSASGKYIGRSSDANGMEASETALENTLTIEEGNFVVEGTAGAYLRYNKASNQNRFRYYKSTSYEGQEAIQLYKRDYGKYTREVPANQYGTICLPNGGNISGATIFEVAYYDVAATKIFFDEVLDGKMEAGMPYIFLPDEDVTKLEVVYTDAVNAPEAGHKNGLWGSYEQTALPIDGQHYILYNNQYWEVNSVAYVGAYRGYLKIGGEGDDFVPKKATPVQQGRRRVAMGVNGEQNATGIEDVQVDNVQGTKVLINNRLFILRGEKMYDATGRLVK